MNIRKASLTLCPALFALCACSPAPDAPKVDYRTLMTADHQLDSVKVQEARAHCAAMPANQQNDNDWCAAVRKAADCAKENLCP
ncbi:hypothetical protein [Pseudomonas eucalypticola]|uniref:EexN family lipoprotein n=2 Tax=Pseudomonas TaxID=286 RepID=A0A7D5DA07_9PSED|nr:hypothetical protein [Pseudomonas eucalypticola]QKZ06437.1 hypothetical protein HWQ56_22720 [Pseudomonas eucalypticola]